MKHSSTHRVTQVADLLRRELSQIFLHEVHDPRVRQMTITQIRLTPDLKEARIYYDCGAERERRAELDKVLKKTTGFLRHCLAERKLFKYVPRLFFFYDDSREFWHHTEEILQDIHQNHDSPRDLK